MRSRNRRNLSRYILPGAGAGIDFRSRSRPKLYCSTMPHPCQAACVHPTDIGPYPCLPFRETASLCAVRIPVFPAVGLPLSVLSVCCSQMSDGRATSPLLVSAALLLLLLLLTPAAEPYGYRRLAKQRFAGLGRHRLSGLGRHAAAVASGLRTGAEQIR